MTMDTKRMLALRRAETARALLSVQGRQARATESLHSVRSCEVCDLEGGEHRPEARSRSVPVGEPESGADRSCPCEQAGVLRSSQGRDGCPRRTLGQGASGATERDSGAVLCRTSHQTRAEAAAPASQPAWSAQHAHEGAVAKCPRDVRSPMCVLRAPIRMSRAQAA